MRNLGFVNFNVGKFFSILSAILNRNELAYGCLPMFVVLLASVSYKLSVCLSKECFLSWHTHLSSFWLTSVGLFQLLDQVGSEGLLVVVSVEVILNFGKSKTVLEERALYPGCSVV